MQRQGRYKVLDCRWDPDTSPNSIGPMEDPLRPSPNTRKRLHRLLDMLLTYPSAESIGQAGKILAGYPWLRDAWEPRITEACERLHDEAQARLRELQTRRSRDG